MVKRIVISALLLFFFLSAVQSQTLSADLQKVKEKFNSSEAFRANVDVRYYKKETDQSAAVVKRGLVKREGTAYYSYFDNKEYLVNKRFTLLVDRTGKTIFMSPTKAQEDNGSKEFSVPEISKKTEELYNILRDSNGDLVTYRVSRKNTGKLSFTITLDQNGSRLVKMIYYGGNSYQRTEILYKYPAEKVVFDKNEFSEEKYVRKQNNTYIPVGTYAGYQLNAPTP